VQAVEVIVDLLVGLVASAYGTLIGAGGGFIMSPVLLLFFGKTPVTAAATSLTAVVFNAVTAVLTYHQQRRIDYFTGVRFAAAMVPGALLGTQTAPYIPATLFKLIFGLVLTVIAGYMAIYGQRPGGRPSGVLVDEATLRRQGKTVRVMVEPDGGRTIYGYHLWQGLLLSSGVGVISSVLGVGGGIIQVPAMISLFGVPPHFAVATSQFMLLVASLTGAASYLIQGVVDVPTAVLLGLGGIAGARLGAAIAKRVRGKVIVRALAIALLLVGVRLLLSGLQLI
jgi:uncharacterized membrane protein YfcA